jgi:hypothetical protein
MTSESTSSKATATKKESHCVIGEFWVDYPCLLMLTDNC